MRFGLAAAPCVSAAAFAHRAFCARLIFFRAAADRVLRPFELELPKAASAAPNRRTSLCALSSSFFKCRTTPDRFPMNPPSAQDCNSVAGVYPVKPQRTPRRWRRFRVATNREIRTKLKFSRRASIGPNLFLRTGARLSLARELGGRSLWRRRPR